MLDRGDWQRYECGEWRVVKDGRSAVIRDHVEDGKAVGFLWELVGPEGTRAGIEPRFEGAKLAVMKAWEEG